MKKFYLSLVLSCITLSAAMAQVTVNATGGVATQGYTTLSAAFNAINAGTHTGAITIDLSGTITEAAAFYLNSSGAGSASYSAINIRPITDGTVISGPTVQGRGLIELNGADNVTIDGDNPNTAGINRNLTITNTAVNTTQYTFVVRLVLGTGVTSTDNITIKNCNLNGSATTRNASGLTTGACDNTIGIFGGGGGGGSATTAPAVFSSVNGSATGTMNNLVVDNNAITACARGISVNGATQASINSISVTNNTFGTPQTYTGAPPFTSASTTIYTVAITIQGATLCTVSGNTISVASYNNNVIRGVEIQGTTVTTLQFLNNIINGVVTNSTAATGNEGLYIGGSMTTCNIIGNTFMNLFSLSNSATSSAINLNNANTTTTNVISSNKISKINNYNTSTGPTAALNLNGPNNVLVNNNMIWDVNGRASTTPPSTTNEVMGIKINLGTGHKLYNNTVHMFGAPMTGTVAHGSTCLMIVTSASTGLDIRNNIFSSQMSGWTAGSVNSCIQLPSGQTSTFNCTLNNNAYYAGTGNVLAQYSATAGTTFTTGNFVLGATTPATNWRSYSSLLNAAGTNDNASLAFTGTAPFVGANTDLHINNASATPLESGGASATITNVTSDVDGQVRPGPAGSVNGGANMPDIGADEFDGIPLDVVPPTITYTALAGTCTTGDRTVNATITDNVGVPVTGTDVPRIYYRKGAGSWFSAAGTLASGTGTNGVWTFTISATDMSGLTGTDQVSYFVVAQDASPNIGASPAAGIVATNVNSVSTPPTTPNIYFIQPASGTFDVGVGKPYTTITAAVNSYNTNTCLTGNIVYNLTDASYPTESYPINIANNALASPSITLTIKPASGVAVSITSSSAAASVIKLTDARFVTIDGLNTGGSSFTVTNGNVGNGSGNIWMSSTGTGCKNITLRNLTVIGGNNGTVGADELGIFATNTTATRANGADNDDITITGNSFQKCGYAIWGGGTAATNPGADDNWVVANNLVGPAVASTTDNLGLNGIFLRNIINLSVTNNTIRNIGANTMTFGTAGMYLETGINRAVVTDNTITNHGCYGTNTSMSIYVGTGVINSRISGNRITTAFNAAATASSIRAIDINANANCNDTIVNNMITDVYSNSSATNTSWPMGIYVEGTTSVLSIWHNSVNLYGDHTGLASTSAGSAALYVSTSGTNIDIRNNVFTNTYNNSSVTGEKSYAVYSTAANTVYSAIDNNNYFVSAGNFLGLIGGTDRALVADMQTGFGGNALSLSVNPNFVSANDLHIVGGVNSGLESGGATVAIATDIDGQVRPGPAGSVSGGATKPDIGADEFDGIPVDVVLPVVSYIALTSSCSAGDRVITATISDNIGVVTTGANMPRLYMKKNTGTYISAPGVLTAGNALSGTWSFTVSATAFTPALAGGDQVTYFIVAQDAANNIGGNPGAGIAGTDVNNITTPPTTPNVYTIFPASGTFNVGTGGTYATITAAVNAYNSNTCLTGHIIYELTDANYPSETYPINIANNPLAGPSVTLTIKPKAGQPVTISGSSNPSLLKFTNARYVTIDGVNAGGASLALTNTNTGSGQGNIWLSSTGAGNNFITLKNMTITGGSNSPGTSADEWGIVASGSGIGISFPGADNDNITVTGNTFMKCGYAIHTQGSAATSAGANDNWVITGNTLGPVAYDGVNGMGVNAMFFTNMVNVDVSNNTVRNIGSNNASGFAPTGFYLGSNVNRMTFRNNLIDGLVSQKTGTTYMVYLGTGVINSIFSGNTFKNLSSTFNPWSLRVFDVNTTNAASNDTFVNNVITDIYNNASTTATTGWVTGFFIEGTNTGNVKVWHNSVNLFGPHAGATGAGSACMLLNSTTLTNIDVRNNVFSNTYDNTPGTTDKNYAVYMASGTSSAFSFMDNNDYYTPTVAGSYTGVPGFIGAADRTNIAGMQAGFGGNIHSVSVNPSFTSNTDLHIPAATVSQLESGGVYVGTTTDIDGNTRSTSTPDIGADEFNGVVQDVVPPTITYTNLVGACGVGNRTFTVTVTDASGVASGATAPRVYYKRQVDPVGSWTSGAGTNMGGNVWSFTILASGMPGLATNDVVQYYVIAQDNAGSVTSVPAAGLVATNVNSVTTHPTTPNNYTILTSLSGPYTVGAGGNYTTLTAAMNAYNAACLSGHVTFNLIDANYSTAETYPIPVNSNPFADSDHTLTIRPAAGVNATITSGSGSSFIFKFSDARFVTLDGINSGGTVLNLVNGNTGANTGNIWLASVSTGNTNITLRNMNITGGSNLPGASAAEWGIIAGNNTVGPNNGNDNDNVTITGNFFLRCGYAVLVCGGGTVSAGGDDNWVVNNNIVGPAVYNAPDGMGVNAMFFRNMLNLDLSNNTVRNTGNLTNTTFAPAGFYLEAGINRMTFRNNLIDGFFSPKAGTSSVVHIGGNVINSIFSGNTFRNMSSTLTGWSLRVFNVVPGVIASNDTIVNNVITDIYANAGTSSTVNWPVGVNLEGSNTGGVKVWYNSINLFGPHAGQTGVTGSACILVNGPTGNNIDIRNNILSNTYDNTASTTDKAYGIYVASGSAATFSNIDFNDYHTPGSGSSVGVMGFLGSDRTNIAAMVAGFGGNANSFTAQPAFVADATDLHLQQINANLPMVAGTPLPVTTDIDGTTRNATTPFVGAHEAPKCSGTLTAGTAVPVAPSLCVQGVTTINDATSTPGIGVKLQWQSSADSATFTNITGATNASYTIPSNITATTYYRMQANCIFSGNKDSATAKVAVYPLPAIITGNDGCFSYNTTLNSADGGGTWLSTNTTVATIGGSSGVVNGLQVGTTTISYTLPSTGCTRTRVLSINPLPVAITGTARVCINGTTDLDNADLGGTWTSTTPGLATVDGTTGVVSGVLNGMAAITYTLPTGCFRGTSVSVDPLPALTVTTVTPATVCIGESVSFNANVPLSTFTLMSQDFNTDMGAFTTTNAFGDPSAVWQRVTAGAGLAGGDGSAMLQTAPILVGSQASSVLTSGPFSTAGMASAALTYNQYLLSDPGDPTAAIEYSTDGGSNWLVLANLVGNTIGDGNWTATDNDTTIALPADAINKTDVRLRWNYNGFLYWAIDNVVVKGTLPPATYGWTGIGAATGIACPTCATPTVTPTVAGANVYQAAATSSAGCISTVNATVSVNPLPQAIGGVTMQVCSGLDITLTDADPDGTWASNTTSVATIGSSSGVVTGHDDGTAIITYTLPTGCQITGVVTTNPLPQAIDGTTFEVCPAHSITLTDPDADGTWSSSATAIADINPTTGVLLAGNAGTAIITYTLPTTCITTKEVTVNPLPDAIGGTLEVCKGLTTTLTDGTTPGTWTSLTTSIATIDGTTGEATGVTAGTATIVYALTTTGCAITAELTVNPLPAVPTAGSMHVCPGLDITFSDSDPDGMWSSSTTAIATIDGTTGVAHGVTDGTATITYTLPTTCISTAVLTVDPLPAAITGDMTVCEGLVSTLGNTSLGGEWYSADDLVATAGSTTGDITGVAAGTVTITYVLPTTCQITTVVTVDPTPQAITGTMHACVNTTTTLADLDLGGTWTSGTTSIATIGSSTGVMTGVAAGTALVTYTLPTTCIITTIVTTDPLPNIDNVTAGGSYCAGSTGVTVGMVGSQAGNTYKLYHGATEVGTFNSTGGAFTFGTYTTAGTYTATATTGLGCMNDMASAANIVITPTVLPEATIVMGPNDTVCEGQNATFTATPVNGGAAPVYQWMVNGTVVGGTSSYTYVPVNGDVVEVSLTSNAICPLPATVTSNVLTAVVTHTLTPSVSIGPTPNDTVCQFSNVMFTAVPVNGGTTPVYTWTKNGVTIAGETGSSIVRVPVNGDVFAAKLTSSYSCPSINNVASNNIAMTVTNVFLPSVEITALPGMTSKVGQTVTLNAVVTPAGNAPTYQWSKNGIDIAGATSATYISANFANNDTVRVDVKGTGECAYATFNSVVLHRTTGMLEVGGNGNIRLIPNPNTGSFTVTGTIASATDEEVTLEVTNMLGQTVYMNKVMTRNGAIDQRVDLDNALANGMYMMTIHAGGEREVFHFALSK